MAFAEFKFGRGGPDDDELDNSSRATSRLKLDRRESGGSGDEEFRLRASWWESAQEPLGSICSLGSSDVKIS